MFFAFIISCGLGHYASERSIVAGGLNAIEVDL